MGIRQIFRDNLKHYRKQKGLSQEKLSELIGYGETYITEIESRHKFPKPETIDLIAHELGIEPYLLFKAMGAHMSDEEKALLEEKSRKNAEFSHDLLVLQGQINALIEKSQWYVRQL